MLFFVVGVLIISVGIFGGMILGFGLKVFGVGGIVIIIVFSKVLELFGCVWMFIGNVLYNK